MDSETLYDRARHLMPWGTQTNAKRPPPTLVGEVPLFFDRADGCRLRTPEGRWYLDFRSSLGPVLLGYKHPAVEAAAYEQLERGVLFSMASPVELEVAERLAAAVPSVEQVHFMKTGNDANSAAVRLARAFTGRDHLVSCGYHGYGDWFACGTGAAASVVTSEVTGVPAALDAFVTRVAYGDTEALERVFAERGDETAAFITVPYDWGADVASGFLERARALTERHGSLLVFDEVLTGFRLARGGGQEYFGVTPDLSAFAKALANGYPLSAYGGRRDVMEMLYRVTITTTYAGEALSLAAAAATLDVIEREPVIEHVWAMGRRLSAGFDAAAARLGLAAHTYGLPPAVQVRFSDDAETDARARLAFDRALYRRGVFASHPFLLSYAHQPADVDEAIEAFEAALAAVADEVPTMR